MATLRIDVPFTILTDDNPHSCTTHADPSTHTREPSRTSTVALIGAPLAHR